MVERRRGRMRREKIRGDGDGCWGFCVRWRGGIKGSRERETYMERQEALGHRPSSLLSDLIAVLGNYSNCAQNGC